MTKKIFIVILYMWYLLPANTTFAFNHADTLRGSNGIGRAWWDAQHYALAVKLDIERGRISGTNKIVFKAVQAPADVMQVDLQEPLVMDKAYCGGDTLPFTKEGNAWFIKCPAGKWKQGDVDTITITYHGQPREAVKPPWDGGISWQLDKNGNPFAAVSCQGLGASVWWPCKDAQWDEPDSGMSIALTVPNDLMAVSNGRCVNQMQTDEGTTAFWEVKNPINTYDATFYVGKYAHWHDTLMGEKGVLDLDFWVLHYNEEKARKQFAIVKQMIHCFEYWMGPYPFYEDGYKLVEAPYLGMEHQSAIAYGNGYKMGYEGHDRTGTGIGMNFDYIVVHESGHEWFGNNVTARDIADNWVHEGITTYSEKLFVECLLGKAKADKYCIGEWGNIRNDKPIIGPYGVNEEGSGDMYDKGAAIMHMIRTMAKDDEKFRMMLRGLGKEYYHKLVTTQEVEAYIATHTGLNLASFFDQYLRTKNIPELEYYIKDGKLLYKFNNTNKDFTLPLPISSGKVKTTINPTSEFQSIKWKGGYTIAVSNDFLVEVKK